jgi:hypothetical protein
MDAPQLTAVTSQLVSRPSSGGRNTARVPTTNPSGNRPTQQDMENSAREQSFWTKYTINILSN